MPNVYDAPTPYAVIMHPWGTPLGAQHINYQPRWITQREILHRHVAAHIYHDERTSRSRKHADCGDLSRVHGHAGRRQAESDGG